jgi:hypothetical protein
MGTEPRNAATEAAALKVKLNTLVKDAKEAKVKAVAARCRARAARTLPGGGGADSSRPGEDAIAGRQLVPDSSSSTTHTSSAASSYEETVVAGLDLQAAAVLNVRSLMNIILDSSSTTYASWRDLMMMVLKRYASSTTSTRTSLHPPIWADAGWTASSSTGSATQSPWSFIKWFGNVVPLRATCGWLSRTSFSVTASSALFTLMLPSVTLCRVITP